MANAVKFIETTSAKLDSLPIVAGRFTFTTDTKLLYRDTSTERIQISSSTPVVITATESTMYITTSEGSYIDIEVNSSGDSLVFTVTS